MRFIVAVAVAIAAEVCSRVCPWGAALLLCVLVLMVHWITNGE